eukprot:scaffold249_cov405-Prasinococcus_capsulatus_cf.AAC.12
MHACVPACASRGPRHASGNGAGSAAQTPSGRCGRLRAPATTSSVRERHPVALAACRREVSGPLAGRPRSQRRKGSGPRPDLKRRQRDGVHRPARERWLQREQLTACAVRAVEPEREDALNAHALGGDPAAPSVGAARGLATARVRHAQASTPPPLPGRLNWRSCRRAPLIRRSELLPLLSWSSGLVPATLRGNAPRSPTANMQTTARRRIR